MVHDLGPPAVGPDGIPPPTIFPSVVRSGVSSNSRSAVGHAKTGHHLVENQQCTARGFVRASADKLRRRHTQPMLPTIGSRITAAIALFGEHRGISVGIVVRQHERVVAVPAVTPGRIRHAERGRGTAGRDEQAVDVAVIVAGELDDHSRPVKPRASRMPHRGFGPRADQPDFFDRRHRR